MTQIGPAAPLNTLLHKIRIYDTASNKRFEHRTSFYLKEDSKLIKNRIFLMKKWKIQVIVFMIKLFRSSERIFFPMRYTG